MPGIQKTAEDMMTMKEIDFLPGWYKNDRRQQISYRTQYIALGVTFVAMMLCNFIATVSIARATKELAEGKVKATAAKDISQEFADFKNSVTDLQNKVNVLDRIDSKIDVGSVLAELSFLIDKKIVLSKIELMAEKFAERFSEQPRSGSVIKAASAGSVGKKRAPLGNVRFKVVLSGVAADASEVAELICRLEESRYFRHVYPSFSRGVEMKTSGSAAGESLQVTKFEISCHLANYQQKNAVLAKKQPGRSLWR
jgi:hypothetical protein